MARDHTEPDSRYDPSWEFKGRKVVVPQGKPIPQSKYRGNSFTQSKYLVYRESQVRLR